MVPEIFVLSSYYDDVVDDMSSESMCHDKVIA
jgi:hypothetical protein